MATALPITDHPRSRGEYTIQAENYLAADGSSPLSRGILTPERLEAARRRIIPALAGNTTPSVVPSKHDRDHPRSRGEYCCLSTSRFPPSGSSPLSRGIPIPARSGGRCGRIIPALAGNTVFRQITVSRPADHPRSRGEYFAFSGNPWEGSGSSPLSRGIRRHPPPVLPRGRIIPALAGNTVSSGLYAAARADHPRSRGEYRVIDGSVQRGRGSSPLSRGIRSRWLATGRSRGIIPALAGNTRSHHRRAATNPDHPRSRGEYVALLTPSASPIGSSPLSRGIQEKSAGIPVGEGIIPALAGNTVHRGPRLVCGRDHPRSRGEYWPQDTGLEVYCGSSPLSRGILSRMTGIQS